MEYVASEYEWESIDRLNSDDDTEHETPEEWYDSYGWHLTTEHAGDVMLQAVEYDWLNDPEDDVVIELLLAENESLSYDEAETIVVKAREIRDAAESICELLVDCVAAYKRGDADEVERLLDEARDQESEYGDSPASSSLRSNLMADLPKEILAAMK